MCIFIPTSCEHLFQLKKLSLLSTELGSTPSRRLERNGKELVVKYMPAITAALISMVLALLIK